jgi:ribosomal protein L37AE/L43A
MLPRLDLCPLCGTKGKGWKGEEGVFECPNCSSVFSKFGVVAESQKEMQENWN